ncbi:unnamed protein product [Eruca vesicaria subsp. sativa]|uniref:Uncharacterized protein n=1 Tax=Eruca vesicaria subsp. sativa TaxID=29727 RepID=A0ABC8KRN8_ERUVS|nr:unnamed protein product [Eruca vesicaria subsp. sativa]
MGELNHRVKNPIPTSSRSIGETSNSGNVVQQLVPTESSEIGGSSSVNDGSVQDTSRPEGVEEDMPEREAGDNQEDSCVRDQAAETSDD